MKTTRFLSWLTATALFLACSTADASLKNKIETEVQRIQAQTGVQIHYLYDPATFFPKEWREDDTEPQAEQLPLDEVWRMIPLIKRLLGSYSQDVLRANLTGIYIAIELGFYGSRYGGTSHLSSIYINCKEETPDAFLLARMHSEFSSILLRKHAFPKEEWARLNPPQFQYAGTGLTMLGQSDLYGQTGKLLAIGFIAKYAQSSLENDFNMMVDWLFTKRARLDQLCDKYPLIRKKRDLALGFYQSLSSRNSDTAKLETEPRKG